MNQVKIGSFIAERRKLKGLTQMQLAEKLNITDKAISKWERGIAMPDSSIMLDLCEILGITVNELLSGEEIVMGNGNQKNEQLLIEMAQVMERRNKSIWGSMWLLLIISMVSLIASLLAAAFLIPEGVWQFVVIIVACIVFLVPCFYVLKLEVSIGAYKCKYCGHEIVPTYKEALMAMHMGTTRYLKCTKCGKKSWCKKVLK